MTNGDLVSKLARCLAAEQKQQLGTWVTAADWSCNTAGSNLQLNADVEICFGYCDEVKQGWLCYHYYKF